MKSVLLGCSILFLAGAANGQIPDAVYAAPGMPVYVQRRAMPAPVRVKAPTEPTIFPRYWLGTDSSRHRTAQVFYRAINSRTKYPATSLQAQVEGVLVARLERFRG